MLVLAQVSSIKTSRSGDRPACNTRHSARRWAMSGRSCSAALSTFFQGQLQLVQRHAERLARQLRLQFVFEFLQRQVRTLGDQMLNLIAIGVPLGNATSLQQRRGLAKLTSLLLDAPHPGLAAPKSQCYPPRPLATITGSQYLATHLFRDKATWQTS